MIDRRQSCCCKEMVEVNNLNRAEGNTQRSGGVDVDQSQKEMSKGVSAPMLARICKEIKSKECRACLRHIMLSNLQRFANPCLHHPFSTRA
jgi:hypothetical protein